MSTGPSTTVFAPSTGLAPTPTSNSTFISPPPQPTTNNGNNNNNGGGGFGNGNGIASSAALYLYTFLATLVLLLSVSAAIVTRSFILRRRHRRMVEEAIRNGTWIPPTDPSPGGRAPRVDLSKKPVMWEAYLGMRASGGMGSGGFYVYDEKSRYPFSPAYTGRERVGGGHDERWEGDVKDWDSIKPLSAAYLASGAAGVGAGVNGNKPAPLNLPSAGENQSRNLGVAAGGDSNNVEQPFMRRVGNGLRHIFSTTSSPTSPLPPSISTTQNVVPLTGAVSATEDGDLDSLPSHTVRVAVLVAMPRPPRHHHHHASRENLSSSSSPGPSTSLTLSPTSSHPLSAAIPSLPQQLNSSTDEDEEPLPVLEVGVAEVMVVRPDEEDEERREGARRVEGKDMDGRDSASLSVEA